MNTTTASSNKYANPTRTCDLIMKGGVTSGLVFPSAVLELANCENKNGGYRFKSIGGASAGAVAAAFAAAAEYNRAGCGFEQLEQVNRDLQETGSGQQSPQSVSAPRQHQGSFLRGLFQATKETQPLLNIVLQAAAYKEGLARIENSKRAGRYRVWRLLAYARLLWKVLWDSGVPGFNKGRLLGVISGVVLGAALPLAGGPALSPDGGSLLLLLLSALVLGLIGILVGGLVGGLRGLCKVVTTEVPKNLFGICSGMPGPAPGKHKAATQWIHESVQAIAGGASPGAKILTFGDLDSRNITLRVMTTNVSEGRPYVLPFDDPLIFRKEDFDDLFPPDVVLHLTDRPRTIEGIELPVGFYFLPARKRLPVVVAARMSMSFPLFFSSVPLYALPMWARESIPSRQESFALEIPADAEVYCRVSAQDHPGVRRSAQSLKEALDESGRWNKNQQVYRPRPEDLIPHWFSDGGIVSNFPIHFFDAWLPDWPTFGVTLRDLPGFLFPENPSAEDERAQRNYLDSIDRWERPGGPATIGSQVHALLAAWKPTGAAHRAAASTDLPHVVVLPQPEQIVSPEWEHIKYPDVDDPRTVAVLSFVWAVVKSMQNYRDNAQAALASYRERVVQVRLRPDEGGFNLDMSRAVIDSVVKKGEDAGKAIDSQFEEEHHQWTRLRVLVAELDEVFRAIRNNNLDVKFESLVGTQKTNQRFPYRNHDPAWCAEFETRLRTLRAVMDEWINLRTRIEVNTGEPPPELRVTPKM